MTQEYKRTCHSCSKVWHSLVSREKEIQKRNSACFSRDVGCCGSNAQQRRNVDANKNSLDKLKSCPNCGSCNYAEMLLAYDANGKVVNHNTKIVPQSQVHYQAGQINSQQKYQMQNQKTYATSTSNVNYGKKLSISEINYLKKINENFQKDSGNDWFSQLNKQTKIFVISTGFGVVLIFFVLMQISNHQKLEDQKDYYQNIIDNEKKKVVEIEAKLIDVKEKIKKVEEGLQKNNEQQETEEKEQRDEVIKNEIGLIIDDLPYDSAKSIVNITGKVQSSDVEVFAKINDAEKISVQVKKDLSFFVPVTLNYGLNDVIIIAKKGDLEDSKKIDINYQKSISRSEIIGLFPEFNFTKGVDVHGEENYLAKSNLALVQLIGPQDNLVEISISLFMDPNNVANEDLLLVYRDRIVKRVVPNVAISDLFKDGDRIYSDGVSINFSYLEVGIGGYARTYTFNL